MIKRRKRILTIVAGVCFLVGVAMGGLSAGQRQAAETIVHGMSPVPVPEPRPIPAPVSTPRKPVVLHNYGCTAEARPIADTIASVSAAHKKPPCEVAYIVVRASKTYGVDPYLVVAVGQTESSWRLRTRGPKGEWGPLQVMPATAREMGVTDLQDWRQTIEAGIRYLRKMIDRANGDLALALAYYNAGPTRGETKARLFAGSYPNKVMELYQRIRP